MKILQKLVSINIRVHICIIRILVYKNNPVTTPSVIILYYNVFYIATENSALENYLCYHFVQGIVSVCIKKLNRRARYVRSLHSLPHSLRPCTRSIYLSRAHSSHMNLSFFNGLCEKCMVSFQRSLERVFKYKKNVIGRK